MKTDIEIAQEAVMEPIGKVAEQIGIGEDDLELYGKYKAKLSDDLIKRVQDRPDGKLVLMTGCTDGRSEPSFYRRFSCYHICK